MKVLFISSWYPNSVNALKGIYIKKHALAVHSAGIDVQVLAITVNYSTKFFEKKVYSLTDENGIKTHMIEFNSRFYKLLYVDLFLQYSFLKKYYFKNIKPEFKPDIIHSHVLSPAAILGHWLSKKEKLPHIITEHWSKVDKFMSKSIYAGQGKKAYNQAKKVTVVSNFLKGSIEKHFADKNKVMVVPNVVNTEIFCFKEKPARSGELIFACVAHWHSPKRPDLIFNALQRLSKGSDKKIVLNVVGEGHLVNLLKDITWNFKINYLGNLNALELASTLQNAHYFLHASEMETFSIVVAEALATGTPVLASNVGAIPELINKQNGFVCNNTVDEWYEGLNNLIGKHDFNGKAISEANKQFGANQIGERFNFIYNEK